MCVVCGGDVCGWVYVDIQSIDFIDQYRFYSVIFLFYSYFNSYFITLFQFIYFKVIIIIIINARY